MRQICTITVALLLAMFIHTSASYAAADLKCVKGVYPYTQSEYQTQFFQQLIHRFGPEDGKKMRKWIDNERYEGFIYSIARICYLDKGIYLVWDGNAANNVKGLYSLDIDHYKDSSAYTKLLSGFVVILQIFPDAGGHFHILTEVSVTPRKGVLSKDYNIISIDAMRGNSDFTETLPLLSIEEDTVLNGCGDMALQIEKTAEKLRYEIIDVNGDGHKDVRLTGTLIECKKHIQSPIKLTFYATKQGFQAAKE